MSSLVILATSDAVLADAWERQIPAGRSVLRIAGQGPLAGASVGLSVVVVLDAAAEAFLAPALARCPTLLVGEPRSLPFEQAKLAGRARVYLSYDESVTRLREFLPLVEEIAEKQAMVELLADKARRTEPTHAPARLNSGENADWWDFLEAAIENLDTRDRLVAEFRRASRHLLRASHTVFFLRDGGAFRADRGATFLPADDPLVALLEARPMVIDGSEWDLPTDAAGELAVRNRLALWGARLLVPIHDNGRLLGVIAFGVRDDGQQYDDSDRARAVALARLLRQFLVKSAQFGRLTQLEEQTRIGTKYLPSTLVLGPDEGVPRHLPLVVRDAIGQARSTRETFRAAPVAGQPLRASAGLIAETGGVWACWQDAGAEVQKAAERQRSERRALLRDLALTLSHELGNALVSLATLRQLPPGEPVPPGLRDAARSDVVKLEALNRNLELMQALHEAHPATVDLRDLARTTGQDLGVAVEVGPEPIPLRADPKLLEFALRSLLSTITENRGGMGARDLRLQLRSTGTGGALTALFSLQGRHMELEGILPEPTDAGVPNQGRLVVLLAKEILRLHGGEIHAGPGLEGTEILISMRSL